MIVNLFSKKKASSKMYCPQKSAVWVIALHAL